MREKKKFQKFKRGMVLLLAIIGTICIALYAIFRTEINTIMSVKKISEKPAYEMTYHGDYALDKYLNTGVESWNELFDFVNENLGKGVGKYIYGEHECSSFYAITPEGDYILARNLDTTVAIPSIIKTNTKSGYKTIGVTNLNVGGWSDSDPITKLTVISSPYFTFDGMNEYGVAASAMTVPISAKSDVDNSKIMIHDLTVVRVIIDKARSVEEAIELLSKYNIKMEEKYPSHYMIADSEGNSAIVEYIDGIMRVIEKTGNYQISTNFALYNNEKLQGYSSDRYKAFEKVLSQTNGIISVEAALELLEENTVDGEAQWSVVYNLSKKTMAVEFYGDYENTYNYSIEDLQ